MASREQHDADHAEAMRIERDHFAQQHADDHDNEVFWERVERCERGLLANEGYFVVDKIPYPNGSDAQRQRSLLAQRIVSDCIRKERWDAAQDVAELDDGLCPGGCGRSMNNADDYACAECAASGRGGSRAIYLPIPRSRDQSARFDRWQAQQWLDGRIDSTEVRGNHGITVVAKYPNRAA